MECSPDVESANYAAGAVNNENWLDKCVCYFRAGTATKSFRASRRTAAQCVRNCFHLTYDNRRACARRLIVTI